MATGTIPMGMAGFVPLMYEGTLPNGGVAVDQQMFTGYKEYYLVDFQYYNSNTSTYGRGAIGFSQQPFVQYTKGNAGIPCRVRFALESSVFSGQPYYVFVLAR